MCPSDPAAYPTYGGWEPAHLGTLTSSRKQQRLMWMRQTGKLSIQSIFIKPGRKILKLCI